MHDSEFKNTSFGLILESLGEKYCKSRKQYKFHKSALRAARFKKDVSDFIVYYCSNCNHYHYSAKPTPDHYKQYVNMIPELCDNDHEGKKSFKTRLSANTVIRYYDLRDAYAYYCTVCHQYHIGRNDV